MRSRDGPHGNGRALDAESGWEGVEYEKRVRTIGKSRHGTHGNHRQTSLVVDSSSTMRAASATSTSGGEDGGTGS